MITLHSLPTPILHVDCDAFFASVEQALHPQLKGRPVVTGKERGIASSMSYEAKARGVTRGMRLFEIKKVCPECVILPSDYETYSLVSQRFFGILRRFTPDVEEYSIDEAFAELAGLRRVYRTSYEQIAYLIKETIQKELGISVSLGLSLTKSLAKIGSKYRKPDGFTCIKGYELHHFLKKIPTEQVCGFGPSSVALLRKHGVQTVWDYVSRPQNFAKRLLGKVGSELWSELRGEPVYPLITQNNSKQRSLSKTKTFTPPSHDREFVRAQVLRNVESAFIKLRRHGLRAKTIAIFIKDKEFHGRGLGAGLSRATSSTMEAVPVVSELFDRIFDSGSFYRQSGVVLNDLEEDREYQHDLFHNLFKIKELRELSLCTDRVNLRFGKHTLHLGSTHYLSLYQQHLGERGDLPLRKAHPLMGETFRQHLSVPLWDIRI